MTDEEIYDLLDELSKLRMHIRDLDKAIDNITLKLAKHIGQHVRLKPELEE